MNKIKDSFSKIKASEDFKNRLANDLQNNSKELKYMKKNKNYKSFIMAASVLVVLIGVASFNGKNNLISNSKTMVSIPKVELPQGNSAISAKMMPLIVYNGKVYLQSSTIIDLEDVKNLLGEKLGTTKPGITEWSTQDEYATEFASTVGVEDVYTVKGYDKSFRIMTYTKNQDGSIYPQLFDCLNGIDIQNGEDIFGKLNIQGNILEVKFRSFNDWNNGIDNFTSIKDLKLFDQFFNKVNKATPILEENLEAELGDYRNEETYKEVVLTLKDGSKLSFSIIKDGYVHYGVSNVSFKVDNKIFKEIWDSLNANVS